MLILWHHDLNVCVSMCVCFVRSAGVGRTGVFIALDHLIQHISDHDFVDVYGLVAELRSERMCMVQNLVSACELTTHTQVCSTLKLRPLT